MSEGYALTEKGEAALMEILAKEYDLTLEELRAMTKEQVVALFTGKRN